MEAQPPLVPTETPEEWAARMASITDAISYAVDDVDAASLAERAKGAGFSLAPATITITYTLWEPDRGTDPQGRPTSQPGTSTSGDD